MRSGGTFLDTKTAEADGSPINLDSFFSAAPFVKIKDLTPPTGQKELMVRLIVNLLSEEG